jgi:hypothetical protein
MGMESSLERAPRQPKAPQPEPAESRGLATAPDQQPDSGAAARKVVADDLPQRARSDDEHVEPRCRRAASGPPHISAPTLTR